MENYIIFLPVNIWDRKALECIEGQIFDSYNDLEHVLLNSKKDKVTPTNYNIFLLSDYMDKWNDNDDDRKTLKDININDTWCGYCFIKKAKDKSKVILNNRYTLTTGQLIKKLEKYPSDWGVTNEQNEEFVHIINDDERVIISTKKPIGTCNRTGTHVYPTEVEGYSAFSPQIDADLINAEWTPFDLFDNLMNLNEPLRSLIQTYTERNLVIGEILELLKVCEVYNYTFDINSINYTFDNLRKK